jgi:hypothetical protein
MLIAGDRRLMRGDRVADATKAAGWAVTGLVTVASVVYPVPQITG